MPRQISLNKDRVQGSTRKGSFLGKVSSKVSKEETRSSRASVILVGRRAIRRRTVVILEIGLEKDCRLCYNQGRNVCRSWLYD